MSDRETIIEKIVKLRALAEGSSSESEAFAAFERAERMMQGYQIEEAELAMAEADGTVKLDIVHEAQHGTIRNGRNRSKAILAYYGIEALCEVQVVFKHGYDHVEWTGHRPDVEYAMWLGEFIHTYLETAYVKWKRTQGTVGRGAKGAFQQAAASAICSRLVKMARERDAQRQQDIEEATKLLSADDAATVRQDIANGNLRELTSTALVIASVAQQKREQINAAFTARHPRLGSGRGFGYSNGGGTAREAGRRAGNAAGLGRPVGGSQRRAIA